MKKYVKLIMVFTLFMCMLNIFSPVFAAESLKSQTIVDTVFGQGSEWFKYNYGLEDGTASKFTSAIFEDGGLIDLITTIGYLVFFIAGAVLGVKYMLSGYEGKAFAKNGLVTYTIGIVFFYLSDGLYEIGKNLLLEDVSKANNFDDITGTIWATFEVIVSTLMVAIVVIYGVKYMWSSANDKAELKKGMVPMVIGAVLIMCTMQIIEFVVNISENTLNTTNKDKTSIVYNLEDKDIYMIGEKYI